LEFLRTLDELRALQDCLPPFPTEEARGIVEANGGDCFASFGEPVADRPLPAPPAHVLPCDHEGDLQTDGESGSFELQVSYCNRVL
jgi:hypothetical protein